MVWLLILFHDVGQGAEHPYIHPEPFSSTAECLSFVSEWKPTPDFTDLSTSLMGDVDAYLFVDVCLSETELKEHGFDRPNVRKVSQ